MSVQILFVSLLVVIIITATHSRSLESNDSLQTISRNYSSNEENITGLKLKIDNNNLRTGRALFLLLKVAMPVVSNKLVLESAA